MLKLLMVVLLSSTGLCKSISQTVDNTGMDVYISSVTNHQNMLPAIDINPQVVDNPIIDNGKDGDGNDDENDATDNDVNEINNDENIWW